ncbi:uncharacterized protein Tco025E_04519 [Trypanosoma conorhini]|uniref:Uncharacterized protein n=1 Tax=Trypanosoma conorhini TaxID=83891 RepID=A0A422PL00_9TRYP|nr:uncharacterized protein Tco025E_04519 [Trypanosoma conorhini]RNF18373.1 hypothetical protein Tco025E_04519 [Trypanosoma conorhini]
MGHESATRYVAAAAIQRWLKRRQEVTRAVRLLGILRALQDEAKGKTTVAHLLQDVRSPTDAGARTTVDSDDEGVSTRETVGLLLALAVAYAERLHTENYARRRRCGGEAGRRLLLLSDAALEQLGLEVRADRGPRGLRQCLDASCIACLSRLVCGAQEAGEAARLRPLWWGLRRALSADAPVAPPHTVLNTLDDVPPLPRPPVVRVGQPLAAARESQTPPPANNDGDDDVAFDTSGGTGDDDDDDDDDSEDVYSDEEYYARQKDREQVRVARIMSLLQMDDPTTAAAGKDATDEAAARESYMQLFGDVGDVLFPALNAAKTTSRKAASATTATGAGGTPNCCCIVCELQDEADRLARCPCGGWVHEECAVSVTNGVPRCSQFCPSS